MYGHSLDTLCIVYVLSNTRSKESCAYTYYIRGLKIQDMYYAEHLSTVEGNHLLIRHNNVEVQDENSTCCTAMRSI